MTMSSMTVSTPSTAAPSVRAKESAVSSFWSRDVFDLVALSCILFVVLTAVAMLIYPGGVYTDPGSQGYRFFENYLSDLGQISTISGALNVSSMIFWIIALISVALGVAAFFLAFTQFFTAPPLTLWLSRVAALFGAITGVGFIGIAASPKGLGHTILVQHVVFEFVAFFSFLLAVLFEIAALLVLERSTPLGLPGLPRRFLWVFVGFVVTLLVYITVVFVGPDDTTLAGEIIGVTAQKVIVCAALATIFAQSIQARRMTSLASGSSARRSE